MESLQVVFQDVYAGIHILKTHKKPNQAPATPLEKKGVMGKQKNAEKALAFQYFLSGRSNKEIANLVGVTEHTIGRWAEEEKWENLELANATRTQSLIKKFEEAIQKQLDIIEKLQDEHNSITKETDALVKLVNSKDKMEHSIPLSAYIQVMEEFLRTVEDPRLRRLLAEQQREFLVDKSNGLS